MDNVEDVERLFSWLKAPMVRYREFAPQREIADAVASWPAVHRAAVDAGSAAADTPAPHGDAAAKERIARDSRILAVPAPAPTVGSAETLPEPPATDAGLVGTLGERLRDARSEPAEHSAAEDHADEPMIAGFEEPLAAAASPPPGGAHREPAAYPAPDRGALFAGEYRERDSRPRDRVADRQDRSLDAVFSRLSGRRDRLPDPRSRARTSPGLGGVFGRLR